MGALLALLLSLLFLICSSFFGLNAEEEDPLLNIRQLTFGGVNTRGRLGPSGRYVTFQGIGHNKYGLKCDQIYRMEVAHPDKRPFRMSTGLGAGAHAVEADESGDIIYSGTFHHALNSSNQNNNFSVEATCPQFICQSERAKRDPELRALCNSSANIYELYPDFDLFRINKWGNLLARLTDTYGYDAEATISPDGKVIAYTSFRSGDEGIWLMSAKDGSNKRQLIPSAPPGYKGGATFSPDGKRIAFHAIIPRSAEELQRYHSLLRHNLIDATHMEIWEVGMDGSNLRQVTRLGAASWSPTYTPDGQHILFSSNYQGGGAAFALYLVAVDGSGGGEVRRITPGGDDSYNLFPMIMEGGGVTQLIWTSSRNSTDDQSIVRDPGEFKGLNIFIADWTVGGREERWRRNRTKGRRWRTAVTRSHSHTHSRHHPPPPKKLHFKEEKHLHNVRQLTFGGQNAEGYFSSADDAIVLQAAGVERYGTQCDQIYRAELSPSTSAPTPNTLLQRLSTGLGVCTCSYYFPDGLTSIHAATFLHANLSGDIANSCPQKQCQTQRAKEDPILKRLCKASYVWDLFPDYDIYKVNEYGNLLARLTDTYGYDAEGAISPDGNQIVFTSMRSGDPELWLMDADGGNLKQLTNELGYDGGPFFSPDGTKIGFRASRPTTPEEVEKYKQLLSYNLVEPLAMELFTINVDGSGMRQLTHLGGSNWAPYYTSDNRRLLFSSNFNSTGFGAFDLYLIGEDGSHLERITYNQNGFDAFPMMSHNGRRVIWGSSRNAASPTELNLFLADWVEVED